MMTGSFLKQIQENMICGNSKSPLEFLKRLIIITMFGFSRIYFLAHSIFHLRSNSLPSEKRIWVFYLTRYSLKPSQQQDASSSEEEGLLARKRTELPESSLEGVREGRPMGVNFSKLLFPLEEKEADQRVLKFPHTSSENLLRTLSLPNQTTMYSWGAHFS